MHTQLCRYLLVNQLQRQSHKTMNKKLTNKGQIIVIFAVSLTVLILFAGLAIDAGSVYITYGNLKRTADSASLAAANEFKRSHDIDAMSGAASEVLNLMNVDYSSMVLLLCDNDMDGNRDDDDLPSGFLERCPDTAAGEAPRKLVYLEVEQEAPLFFMSLIGFTNIHLHTNSISEAAPLDVVIVLDTSESMASETSDYSPYESYDPSGCNSNNTCQPMLDAKNAAKALIDTLASGYDMVSVVTFDTEEHIIFSLGTDLGAAKTAIDNLVQVHDDPPVAFYIWSEWYNHPGSYNPLNSEDLDGNGVDADPNKGYTCPFAANPANDPAYLQDRWWTQAEGAPAGNPLVQAWGGVPCDRDDRLDSMDWKVDSIWTQDDHDLAQASVWGASGKFSALSTCSGCGLRAGTNQLRGGGRFSSVWVMVFLSDGAVNLSDSHAQNPDGIPATLVNGACGGHLNGSFWNSLCWDNDFTPRYCIDTDENTCPPGSTHTTTSPNYSVLDYAMDMVDTAALTKSTKADEPLGNDLAIYSIRLGNVSTGSAEAFLRYMAAVGDDGDRTTNPCTLTLPNTSCGQYYFAPSGDHLLPIFEDIASRIYTRLSQ